MSQARWFAAAGAALALLAVAAGAFAAHLLDAYLPPDLVEVFETAVRYQMYHAVGLLIVGAYAARRLDTPLVWAGRLFLVGTIVFSGSLYLLALTGLRWFGAITPIGGLCLLGGWGAFLWGIVTHTDARLTGETG